MLPQSNWSQVAAHWETITRFSAHAFMNMSVFLPILIAVGMYSWATGALESAIGIRTKGNFRGAC
jgi:hypothetical protein